MWREHASHCSTESFNGISDGLPAFQTLLEQDDEPIRDTLFVRFRAKEGFLQKLKGLGEALTQKPGFSKHLFFCLVTAGATSSHSLEPYPLLQVDISALCARDYLILKCFVPL